MKNTINIFLESKKIAVVGVSDSPGNFGKSFCREINKIGYETFPVNPLVQEISGMKNHKDFSELPGEVNCAVFAVGENTAFDILSNQNLNNIKAIWLLKGAASERNVKAAENKNLNVAHTYCPLIFFYDKGFHRFHYKILKFFRKIPAELRN